MVDEWLFEWKVAARLNLGRKLGVWGWKAAARTRTRVLACRMNMGGDRFGQRV